MVGWNKVAKEQDSGADTQQDVGIHGLDQIPPVHSSVRLFRCP